jgi:hypothetical protein
MSNADCVICSKDLTYEPYRQSRGDGFSGQLLMAAETNNPDKRYIIKSGEAHVAACEFMFYRLASELGLPVAPVRLVEPAKRGEFKYPACAVDFIPDAVMLPYDEYKEIAECRMLTDLSYILGDRDHMEFLRDGNGSVYKIDHSDCFGIESTAETWLNPKKVNPSFMFYQMSRTKPNVSMSIKEDAGDLHERIAKITVADFDDEFDLLKKYCGKPFEDHFHNYIDELISQCKQQ